MVERRRISIERGELHAKNRQTDFTDFSYSSHVVHGYPSFIRSLFADAHIKYH